MMERSAPRCFPHIRGGRRRVWWPRLLAAAVVALTYSELRSQDATKDAAPPGSVVAEQHDSPVLRVGTKEAVPFSMRKADGTWTGISVELWRLMAKQLRYEYEFVELPLDELFTQLEAGRIDVAVAALTITHAREKRVDFTHAYFNTGLGIAVVPGQGRGWTAVVQRVVSKVFLEIIAGILAVLIITGVLVYFFERRCNPEHFGQGHMKGVANGIWWAAVTMTTVGYGDRVPKSLGGRLMAVIWMFSAILILSSFTASVTSTLTLARLESNVTGPRDLLRVSVATIPGSSSAAYLDRERIVYKSCATPMECLTLLRTGKVDAVVYDAPILRHLCLKEFKGELEVLPATFEKQDYAIALPENSSRLEALNQTLLEALTTPAWQETLERYLGNQGT